MGCRCIIVIISMFFLLTIARLPVVAQNIIRGAVVEKGTGIKVNGARVFNKNNQAISFTNNFGVFQLKAAPGDSLEISSTAYLNKKIQLVNLQDIIVYLQSMNLLEEVVIKGTNLQNTSKEAAAHYSKEKGIYYNGKPPLILLNPFGGKPLTFFHELLGSDAKRVRRLNKLARNEIVNNEIDRRFNSTVIKSLIPIKEEDLDAFKIAYEPTLADLRKWTDYELLNYIKQSFETFKKKQQP